MLHLESVFELQKEDEPDDNHLEVVTKGVFSFPLGEDAVVAGLVPASSLLGSAIGAHVLSHNQDRTSSRQ